MFWTAISPHGRYTINPGGPRFIPEVASDVPPPAEVELGLPRRGDRVAEPRHAACEQLQRVSGALERVWGPHDAFGKRAGGTRAA